MHAPEALNSALSLAYVDRTLNTYTDHPCKICRTSQIQVLDRIEVLLCLPRSPSQCSVRINMASLALPTQVDSEPK